MSGVVVIQAAGEELHLLPQRAVWWPRLRALIVADLHFGKTETFHSRGIPIPGGSLDHDLARLDELIVRHDPSVLYIAGDLVHARHGLTGPMVDRVASWRASHPGVSMVLIRGNHDRRSGQIPSQWNLVDGGAAMALGSIAVRHDVDHSDSGFQITGHVHPVYYLRDASGARFRAPCFALRAGHLLLPSFGFFTGGFEVERTPNLRIFLCGPESVLEIPAK